MNSRFMRNGFIYLLIVVAVIAIFFSLFSDVPGGSKDLYITEVVAMAKRGDIDTIEVSGNRLTIIDTQQKTYTSRIEQNASIVDILVDAGIDPYAGKPHIVVVGSSGLGSLFGILFNFLPSHFLRRRAPVHDASGTGKHQPDLQLRAQSRQDARWQPA